MSEQQIRVTAIRIEQMDCPTEERLLRKALEKKPGVTDLRFNLMSRVLSVTHDPAILDDVMQSIRKVGFTPELHDGKSPARNTVGKSGCCGHDHDHGATPGHNHHDHQHSHDHDHQHHHEPGASTHDPPATTGAQHAQAHAEVSP